MKKLRLLLATSLLVALGIGFYSCGDDEFEKNQLPQTDTTENLFLTKFGIDQSQYKYFHFILTEADELMTSGLKDNHIEIATYDTLSFKKTCEVIDTEEIKEQITKYLGYGESITLSLSNILPRGLIQTENGYVGQLDLVYAKDNNEEIQRTAFFNDGKSLKKSISILTGNDNFTRIYKWYKDAVIFESFKDWICCNDKGDTLYVTQNSMIKEAIPISYTDGININGLYISRCNYSSNDPHNYFIWSTNVNPPLEVPANAKISTSILDQATNIWKCKADITYYDGTKKDFTFEFNIEDGTVIGQIVKVTGLSINEHTINLKRDKTFQLVATVQPSNATNKNIIWSSSNETIASISKDGLITAKSVGEACITIKTEDGNFSTTAIVTVSNSDEENKVTLANLKGTWDMVKCYGWEYNDQNIKEDWEESVAGEYIFFKDENGNGEYYNGYQTYNFASSVKDNKLILRNSNWLSGKTITITKLTSTELHITATDAESEENYEMQKRGSGNGVVTSPIIGTWKGGEVGTTFVETLTFNSNGKGNWDEDAFTYTLNSNKVVLDYGDNDPETWTFSVAGTKLSMTAEDGAKYSFTKK